MSASSQTSMSSDEHVRGEDISSLWLVVIYGYLEWKQWNSELAAERRTGRVWRSAGTYGVRSSRLSKALKPGAEASQGRVGPCLIIWGLASRQPGATTGELFTERPSVTCRSASRGFRA